MPLEASAEEVSSAVLPTAGFFTRCTFHDVASMIALFLSAQNGGVEKSVRSLSTTAVSCRYEKQFLTPNIVPTFHCQAKMPPRPPASKPMDTYTARRTQGTEIQIDIDIGNLRKRVVGREEHS